jgi:hypothetical protein
MARTGAALRQLRMEEEVDRIGLPRLFGAAGILAVPIFERVLRIGPPPRSRWLGVLLLFPSWI